MRACLLAVVLAAPTALTALDVVGEVSYLDRKIRPEWRQEPLAGVLMAIGKLAEKPIELAEDARAQQNSIRVTYAETERVTLRDCLATLESAYDIAFTAEPLRLQVETSQDRRDRRRRTVDIHLRDYGVFVVSQDMPQDQFGWGEAARGGGGFNLYANPEADVAQAASPEDIIAVLRTATGNADRVRGGNVHLHATPEEEAGARALLEEQYRTTLATRRWRATFGLAPAGPFPTGIVATADATALAARLEAAEVAEVSAVDNQVVHGGTLHERAVIEDAEVVDRRLDPTIGTITFGRSLQLRSLRGRRYRFVDYRVAWVAQDGEDRAVIARGGRTASPIELALQVETKDEKTASSRAELQPPPRDEGERVPLTLPRLWSWQPRGDVALPPDAALVLCAPRGGRTAVIVLEEVP